MRCKAICYRCWRYVKRAARVYMRACVTGGVSAMRHATYQRYPSTRTIIHKAEARRLLKQRAEEAVVRGAAEALKRVVETGTCVYVCVCV